MVQTLRRSIRREKTADSEKSVVAAWKKKLLRIVKDESTPDDPSRSCQEDPARIRISSLSESERTIPGDGRIDRVKGVVRDGGCCRFASFSSGQTVSR